MTDAAQATALAAVRTELDAIDDALLALLARRLELAPRIAALKPGAPLYRPVREAALLERVAAGPVPAGAARAIWTEIMGAMLAAEGLRAIVVETPELADAVRLRFGRVLSVRVDPDAAAAALAPDVIAVLRADSAVPAGTARVAEVPGGQGGYAGYVAQRIEEPR